MVECVTLFDNLVLTKDFAVQWDYNLTKLLEFLKILVLWDGSQEICGSNKGSFQIRMYQSLLKPKFDLNSRKRSYTFHHQSSLPTNFLRMCNPFYIGL